MFVKGLNINVIATFELDKYQESQDIFDLKFIHKNILKSKKTLLDYIKLQLDPNRKLVKLSLCWVCSKEIVDKYKVIQRSIKQNAKYYFEDGKEVK